MSQAPGLAASFAQVRRRIEEACAAAGRAPAEVTLIAVSKLQPVTLVQDAYALGHRDFGENYAQELRDKAQTLAALGELRWHGIGPLQTNKAKYVAQTAYAFHALDRLEVAAELSRRRGQGPALRCLLEVNLSGEATKSGVTEQALPALLEGVRALPSLEGVGLMTLPPLAEDPEASRPYFARLRELAARHGLPWLSMGTTADYEVAISEGATHVRVGTALFGQRPPRAP